MKSLISFLLILLLFVFNIFAETENIKSIDVFGIPLNGSIQDIVNVLEKKGIDFEGSWREEQMQNFQARLRDDVQRLYKSAGITGERKEAGLKVVDEKRIKFFPFTYKNKRRWLRPVSLDRLLRADLLPVFDKYYENFNTQFHIMSHGRRLSDDMRAQEISKISIGLGCINQDEPKSAIITLSLFRANPKLYTILNKKYGLPKIHYAPVDEGKLYSTKLNAAIEQLKNQLKNYEEHTPNEIIYKKIQSSLVALDSFELHYIIRRPFLMSPNVDRGTTSVTFEWNCGDVKILGSFTLSVDKEELLITPDVINYIYYPLAVKFSEAMEDIYNAARSAYEKTHKEAGEGF